MFNAVVTSIRTSSSCRSIDFLASSSPSLMLCSAHDVQIHQAPLDALRVHRSHKHCRRASSPECRAHRPRGSRVSAAATRCTALQHVVLRCSTVSPLVQSCALHCLALTNRRPSLFGSRGAGCIRTAEMWCTATTDGRAAPAPFILIINTLTVLLATRSALIGKPTSGTGWTARCASSNSRMSFCCPPTHPPTHPPTRPPAHPPTHLPTHRRTYSGSLEIGRDHTPYQCRCFESCNRLHKRAPIRRGAGVFAAAACIAYPPARR